MLNYIWAGLVVSSFVFAIGYDVADLTRDTYRNGEPLPVELTFPQGDDGSARTVPVRIRIDPSTYASFYDTDAVPETSYDGYLVRSQEGVQLRFSAAAELPEPLATIRGSSSTQEGELQGTLVSGAPATPREPDEAAAAAVRFEPTRFVKLNAIAASALSSAETAATIALGLIGVLVLFLGLLQIAEQAGIIQALVRFVRPVLRPLFPEIPEDHPALGMIALNLTANVFGLGNAATPFGIKAMEEMQKLNPRKDTATNPMVMFLAINTASVQIVPPVLLLALLGLQINELIFAIILTTGLSLVVAIVAAKVYGRLPGNRASDPNREGAAAVAAGSGGAEA
ncbi:MAG TPA: nucleoside recognition domain-containing protein [Longimicrobiales bacterium]|nr:nucleoside recognition domain-containing protein [Longimicrobiales bacterium]